MNANTDKQQCEDEITGQLVDWLRSCGRREKQDILQKNNMDILKKQGHFEEKKQGHFEKNKDILKKQTWTF